MIDRRPRWAIPLARMMGGVLVVGMADRACAMTGLGGGFPGLGFLYAGVIATVALVVAAALAGWRYLPWGIGCALASTFLIFRTLMGDEVIWLSVIVPSVATCVFLVLAYRRPG